MARRTNEQLQTNRRIWENYTAGKVDQAITEGQNVLATPAKADKDVSFYAHTALQVVHMLRHRVTERRQADDIVQDMGVALDLIGGYFPLESNPARARQKAMLWDEALDEPYGHIHALRNAADLFEVLSFLLKDSKYLSFSHALLQEIIRFSSEHNYDARILQLIAIQDGQYQDAKSAFKAFVQQYGVGSDAGMFDQQAVIASRMLGRARWRRDFETSSIASQQIRLLREHVANESVETTKIEKQKILAKNAMYTVLPALQSLKNTIKACVTAPRFWFSAKNESKMQTITRQADTLTHSFFAFDSNTVRKIGRIRA